MTPHRNLFLVESTIIRDTTLRTIAEQQGRSHIWTAEHTAAEQDNYDTYEALKSPIRERAMGKGSRPARVSRLNATVNAVDSALSPEDMQELLDGEPECTDVAHYFEGEVCPACFGTPPTQEAHE